MSSRGTPTTKNRPRFFERLGARMLPFDHMTVLYCWTIIILTVNFARPLGDFIGVIAFHIGVVALVVMMAYFLDGKTARPAVFFRLLYPVILMTFFYETSGKLVHLFIPGWLDGQVVAFEKSILGIHPTIWLENHLNIVVTEILSASYFSYYFLIPGLPLFLFFHKRDKEIKRYMTATCITFFVSYLIFIFYPVVGPRFHFADVYQTVITGVFFRPMVDMVIENAAFKGGAMPSSHIAEALVVMLFALRYYGKKAWFVVPVVAGLALGTVYGRFHYILDAVVGILIGIIAALLVFRFYPIRKEDDLPQSVPEHEVSKRYVS